MIADICLSAIFTYKWSGCSDRNLGDMFQYLYSKLVKFDIWCKNISSGVGFDIFLLYEIRVADDETSLVGVVLRGKNRPG